MNKIDTDQTVQFSLNGVDQVAQLTAGQTLSDVLREGLGQRDVKVGCNAGDCGSCTVLVNGEAVCACLTPAQRVSGCRIETAQGLEMTCGGKACSGFWIAFAMRYLYAQDDGFCGLAFA